MLSLLSLVACVSPAPPSTSTCTAAAWAWGADITDETAETTLIGAISAPTDPPTAARVSAAGDLDGDHLVDLLAFTPRFADGGGAVWLLPGLARERDQVYTDFASIQGSADVPSVADPVGLGDIDGDGLTDVAVQSGAVGRSATASYLFRGGQTGTRTLDDADAVATLRDGASSAVTLGGVGDGTGDGVADWWVFGAWPDLVSEVHVSSHPTGSLLLSGEGWTGSRWDAPSAHGDFDGDGRGDVAGVYSSAGVYVLFGANWDSEHPYGAVSAIPIDRPGALLVGDFDGDGRDDLVVPGALALRLYRGRPPWETLDAPDTTIATSTEVVPYAVGDIDGDGLDDFGYHDGPDNHLVFGRTTWTSDTVADVDLFDPAPSAPYWDGAGTRGDLDGDGIDDLVLTRRGTTLVFRGRESWGSGFDLGQVDATFIPDDDEVTGATSLLVDLDGDGCDDLVTARAPLVDDTRASIVVHHGQGATGP
jgi:hypothetical protein